MKQVIISFGLLITALLVLFRLSQFYYSYNETSTEIRIAAFSILFLLIGILISKKLFNKTTLIIEQRSDQINQERLIQTGISKREAEIILLINDGLSNQQIADKLFVSESTVKKHISNIFLKLNVERRTEAVKKAKELSIIS